jgi:hypothetical protein
MITVSDTIWYYERALRNTMEKNDKGDIPAERDLGEV